MSQVTHKEHRANRPANPNQLDMSRLELPMNMAVLGHGEGSPEAILCGEVVVSGRVPGRLFLVRVVGGRDGVGGWWCGCRRCIFPLGGTGHFLGVTSSSFAFSSGFNNRGVYEFSHKFGYAWNARREKGGEASQTPLKQVICVEKIKEYSRPPMSNRTAQWIRSRTSEKKFRREMPSTRRMIHLSKGHNRQIC